MRRLVLVACAACAACAPVDPRPAGVRDDAASPTFAGDTIPRRAGARRYAHHGGEHVVYLEFGGAELECGDDDASANVSSIACYGGGLESIPPFDPSGYPCESVEDCQQQILAALTESWSYRWDLRFVLERPPEGDYEMVVVGGGGFGALGLAPLDCGDAGARDVSFAFSDDATYGCAIETVTATISQELGHALGLCHNDEPDSVMYPSAKSCSPGWECGEQVDDCYCGGGGYDPFCPAEYLDELLGPAPPDTSPPGVAIVSPPSGAGAPARVTVRAAASDDRGVEEVTVSVDGETSGPAEPGAAGFHERELDGLAAGEHLLCAVARDRAGNEGSACVRVTVGGADCVPGSCCCGLLCCREECAAERAAVGAPCAAGADCCSGACLAGAGAAYCTQPCAPSGCGWDDECPAGFDCRAVGEEHLCVRVAEPRTTGWPCGGAADCLTGLCLQGEGASLCTLDCSAAGEDVCPERWRCRRSDGAALCAPECAGPASVRGGCAVAPARRNACVRGGAWALALACALLARRRSVRQRGCDGLSHPSRRER